MNPNMIYPYQSNDQNQNLNAIIRPPQLLQQPKIPLNNQNQLAIQQNIPSLNFGTNNQFQIPGLAPNLLTMQDQARVQAQTPVQTNNLQNFNGGIPNLQIPGLNIPQQPKAEVWKKLFVNDIPEELPTNFIEKLLKSCGDIVDWKRRKDGQGKLLKFGYVEFLTVEGILKAIRLLNNLSILDKSLKITSDQKTELFINQWKELKRSEWNLKIQQQSEEIKDFSSFDEYLQKDDLQVQDKIQKTMKQLNNEIDKVKEEKEREESKKEHPREREREYKRRQYKTAQDKRGKDRIGQWIKREDEKKRERKKEKELEKEREKEKLKLLQRELTHDSQEEIKFYNRFRNQDRKKQRQRELEDDLSEKKKEIEKEMEEQERMNIINSTQEDCPLPDFMIQIPEDIDIEEPKEIYKPTSFVLETENTKDQEEEQKQQEQQYLEDMNDNQNGFNLTIKSIQQKIESKIMPIQDFVVEEEEINQPIVQQKLNLPKSIQKLEEQEKQRRVLEQQNMTEEHKEEVKKKELQVKSDIKSIIKMIPGDKNSLFNFSINWPLFAQSNLLEKKVKPWLLKKSVEYMGQEEPIFVNMILKKLINRESAFSIIKKVEKVLDEDAEEFMVQMWRTLVFELLKLEKLDS